MTDNIQREIRDIWNQNAAFWDQRGGDNGLIMQRTLIDPSMERLLDLKPGERLLEIACGNGAFARRMAQHPVNIVACDFAAAFIELAKARTTENRERIDYRVIDANDQAALLTLGTPSGESFDAVCCSMAIMDMAEIDPMLRAVRQLLKLHGRFVFSITHPCFNSGQGIKRVIEQEDKDGEIIDVYAIKISNYATPTSYKGLGIIGQPAAQFYFHRPLNVLFGACFRTGFVIDALEEPTFESSVNPNRPLSWDNYREIPPVLIARLRIA
ncbi:MAG: class I SAM-dependent methyltransferase [Chloroflexi bacterium]|nr:class I SAM-dependent methyltransferase [Chloroflexota bacterium]